MFLWTKGFGNIYALSASLRECLSYFSQHSLWLARILRRNMRTEFRNLEIVTFKSSLLRGEHGTRNVRIFLRFHVNLPFLVSYLVHLVSGRVCSNFLSALWKNTPDNFSKTTPKQTTLAAFLTFTRHSIFSQLLFFDITGKWTEKIIIEPVYYFGNSYFFSAKIDKKLVFFHEKVPSSLTLWVNWY